MPPVRNRVIQFNEFVRTIENLLAEEPGRRWNFDMFQAEIAKRTGTEDNTHYRWAVQACCYALRSAGVLCGKERGLTLSLVWKGEVERVSPDRAEEIQAFIREKVQAELVSVRGELSEKDKTILNLSSQLTEMRKNQSRIQEIHTYEKKGGKPTILKEKFHAVFEKVLKLAQARKNIFIYGPTGSGKTHICEQLASVLKLKFGFVSCTAGMSESVLSGRLLPVGAGGKFEYVISDFVKCYEEGGVFLLDEMDAADPNVLLIVNSAIANGKISVPNRPSKPYAMKHPDFILVGAANTVGTGADRMYKGRNALDASTLDRFMIGKVFMDYDSEVETHLCPDTDLLDTLWKIRNKVREHRLERSVSTRFLRDAYDMKQVGWTHDEILQALFQGWREDEIHKVK